MAFQYIGVNRGGREPDVATGSSTTSKDVEVAIDLSKNCTREDVLLALKSMENFILSTRITPFKQ